MLLLFAVDACEGVEISGQPSAIFCEQSRHKFLWRARIRSNQILPCRLRVGTTGDLHAAAADRDLTAIKI